MKISKLFHWLYAILMLLPVFFIGSRCFYVILNKNAKDSYYGETINEEINTYYDIEGLQVNEHYYFTNPLIANDTSISDSYFNFIYLTDFSTENEYLLNRLGDNVPNRIEFYYQSGQPRYRFYNGATGLFSEGLNSTSYRFEFTFLGSNINSNLTTLNSTQMFFITTYNEYSYLDNAFEYSINSLNEVQLFSWAQTSFLSAPMVYITGLFGMPSNSPVITLLSYWLSISIVWLVFDLVMYIPLLVHRWIDRGIIE